MSKTFILLTFILVISCKSNIKSFDLFEENKKEIILKNNINQIIEIEIGIDTAGVSLWKRTSQINHYDKNGYLVETIVPSYLTKPWPTIPGGMTLKEIAYYSKMSKTNIPNGEIDTTYYKYDNIGNLLTIKNKFTTTFKYDEHNNQIEKCISSEFNETICNIQEYEYDKNERIISKNDSSGVRSKIQGRKFNIPTKKVNFKYDNEDRIISNGEYERVFNSKGQLIEVKQLNESNTGDKYVFSYNNEGERVSEIFTQVTSSSWDSVKNIVTYGKPMKTKKYFYYNEKGLLKQEKKLDENDIMISLKNYEYSFN